MAVIPFEGLRFTHFFQDVTIHRVSLLELLIQIVLAIIEEHPHFWDVNDIVGFLCADVHNCHHCRVSAC